jgi:hypothetical protein
VLLQTYRASDTWKGLPFSETEAFIRISARLASTLLRIFSGVFADLWAGQIPGSSLATDSTKTASLRLGQTIVNGHVVYVHHGLELLNEGFLIRHAYEQSSTVYNIPAFYSQVSKQFGTYRNLTLALSLMVLTSGPAVGQAGDIAVVVNKKNPSLI